MLSEHLFSTKWDIKERKKYRKIIGHVFVDGVEYKRCFGYKGERHWETLCNFSKNTKNWDGYDKYCKQC